MGCDSQSKLSGMLGLCQRSGGLISGAQGVHGMLQSGRCALLLLDAEASEQTRQMYQQQCTARSVPMATLPPGLLSAAIGKSRMVAGTTDSWAKTLIVQCEAAQAAIFAGVE